MSQKKNEKIPFLNVYLKCVERIEKKITKKDFEQFLSEEVRVDKYLSIQIKKSLIDIFFLVNDDDKDFTDMSFIYEVYSVLGFLLMYTNIDISSEEMSEENYEIVIQSGLSDWIQKTCDRDYQRLYKMGLNAIVFRNSFIINSLAKFTPDDLSNSVDGMKNIMDSMSDDKLSLMKSILELNDPNMVATRDAIYSGVELFAKDKKLQDLKEE